MCLQYWLGFSVVEGGTQHPVYRECLYLNALETIRLDVVEMVIKH